MGVGGHLRLRSLACNAGHVSGMGGESTVGSVALGVWCVVVVDVGLLVPRLLLEHVVVLCVGHAALMATRGLWGSVAKVGSFLDSVCAAVVMHLVVRGWCLDFDGCCFTSTPTAVDPYDAEETSQAKAASNGDANDGASSHGTNGSTSITRESLIGVWISDVDS